MTPKPKRRLISVRWAKSCRLWAIVDPEIEEAYRHTKVAAVKMARVRAAWHAARGLAQVRIYGKNGRIQTEWTYPRSSDPRRRRG